MRKLQSIQGLRGLAAVMVVAFHSLSIQAKYLAASSVIPAFALFGQTGVDLFFVISGFVMATTALNKPGTPAEILTFLRHRFLRIYPVYWVFFLLLTAVYLLRPEIINSSQGGKVDLLSSFLLLPSGTLPILMVAWSLTHELWFYLVFAALLLLPRAARVPAIGTWALLVLLSRFVEFPPGAFLRVITHEFTLEFILGALAGVLYMRPRQHGRSRGLGLAGLAASIGLLVLAMKGDYLDGSDVLAAIPLGRALLFGGGYALMILGFALLERSVRVPSACSWLGDISYSLYLSHLLTLSAAGRIWSAIKPSAAIPEVMFWVAAYAATIAVAYLSYRLLEAPLIRSSFYRGRAHSARNETPPAQPA
ncbi:acyltransferase [Pseudomonas sp. ZM23]|uniref:Acyltransferase n=1 Tax=Pseudomonas triclosanedens TaxID=2961893 RepID=A0ABY7A5R9_9PSED|nr:acyltransferase [Pseudomonas triclosanedens]MCP8466364.1 acyltransferase [Pseudomonas triclosanedens]MCP8471890.1 acyltransferase [Pseudomonas triclosanedens]MCP8478585.1 acyltransferase [Pseudomonas triclosanedens]WAI52220.1 acyltransferase [Pseudomonas triclosanedens]